MAWTATGVSVGRTTKGDVELVVDVRNERTGSRTRETFVAGTLQSCIKRVQLRLDAQAQVEDEQTLAEAVVGRELARTVDPAPGESHERE